jgi:hypothetical protein
MVCIGIRIWECVSDSSSSDRTQSYGQSVKPAQKPWFATFRSGLLQKVFSTKTPRAWVQEQPPPECQRGLSGSTRGYFFTQPPGGIGAAMIGLLGGGGGRQVPEEPFAPLGPQLTPPVGGDGGGSPFAGAAKAAPNVESSSAMTSA